MQIIVLMKHVQQYRVFLTGQLLSKATFANFQMCHSNLVIKPS